MGVLAKQWNDVLVARAEPATLPTVHKLSVVIPAYNEEDGIAAIVQRVLKIKPALQAIGIEGPEVVVVDDGSRDHTADVVGRFEGVKLVCHGRNRGYGAALKTGFYSSTGDMLSFLDADGTYPPESFPALCKEVMDGAELVIGSRMGGERSEMPATRRLGNLFFAGVLSLVGNQRVSDSASGMRVFRRDVLDRMYPLPNGLNFTPAMSTRAMHEGLKMVEVPIPYSERVGRSKLSVVRDGLRFLYCIVWTALTYNPVRILGWLGFLGMGLATLVVAIVAALRLTGVTTLDVWGVFAVYAALVTAVASVSLFSLGAISNYLVSLFQKRPIRQGLFGKPIFNPPLDRQFWWMGALSILLGIVVGATSLALSFSGWEIARLWLWLVGSAMLVLMGLQLVIGWVVMRILEELSQRELKTSLDLEAKGS
jgi:glycosyltransferase involved in cell wall biosynthesis